MLHPTELFCALLSCAAPYWSEFHSSERPCSLSARLFPTELLCTLLNRVLFFWATLHPRSQAVPCSYTAPYWATHPAVLCYTYWATLNPSELEMHPLSYAAPYCAMLHPTELQCTPLSYNTLWGTLHTTELSFTFLSFPCHLRARLYLLCTLLSYEGLNCATLHSTELRCTLRSKDAPYWSALHPCTLLNYTAPSEPRCTLTELPPFKKIFRMPEMSDCPAYDQFGTGMNRSADAGPVRY
jgi:hypothetical protein